MLTAVGCVDPGDRLPAETRLERSKQDKHRALVRCRSSEEAWQVTCQHGVWSLDNVGNCTTTRPQVEGPPVLVSIDRSIIVVRQQALHSQTVAMSVIISRPFEFVDNTRRSCSNT